MEEGEKRGVGALGEGSTFNGDLVDIFTAQIIHSAWASCKALNRLAWSQRNPMPLLAGS